MPVVGPKRLAEHFTRYCVEHHERGKCGLSKHSQLEALIEALLLTMLASIGALMGVIRVTMVHCHPAPACTAHKVHQHALRTRCAEVTSPQRGSKRAGVVGLKAAGLLVTSAACCVHLTEASLGSHVTQDAGVNTCLPASP